MRELLNEIEQNEQRLCRRLRELVETESPSNVAGAVNRAGTLVE